jgi:arylsulfatase A-like enzyme
VERGVRFIEVSHNLNFLNGAGWDVHNEGILKQHALIEELDTAVSTLITDLETHRLLDDTLIIISTEFGRPPEFDSGGGRGHQGSAFTCVLAGGGLNHQGAFGQTDELGKKIVADPVSVADFFATIHAAVGIDYSKNLYDGDRPVPITDLGHPIAKLFS